MNRPEVYQFLKSFLTGPKSTGTGQGGTDLKPFFDLVVSLKQNLPLSIPLLRDLAELTRARDSGSREKIKWKTGVIKSRIERRYRRLCRVQEELERLDLKKAAPGVSPEDYIFSRIDFSRYRTIEEREFEALVPDGLTDFGEDFFRKNFGSGRSQIQSLITGSYKKAEGSYRLQTGTPGEEPLILSIMRNLETSLECLPLFSTAEINEEMENLLGFVCGGGDKQLLPRTERLYPLLVSGLDNVRIPHEDGMTTRLFISPNGDLSGTFRPGNKPWTIVLIPA